MHAHFNTWFVFRKYTIQLHKESFQDGRGNKSWDKTCSILATVVPLKTASPWRVLHLWAVVFTSSYHVECSYHIASTCIPIKAHHSHGKSSMRSGSFMGVIYRVLFVNCLSHRPQPTTFFPLKWTKQNRSACLQTAERHYSETLWSTEKVINKTVLCRTNKIPSNNKIN